MLLNDLIVCQLCYMIASSYARLVPIHEQQQDNVSKTGFMHGDVWPMARIPFVIEDTLSPALVLALNSAFNQFHQRTCVRFVDRHSALSVNSATNSNDEFYLRIRLADSCWSYVGRLAEFARRGQPLALSTDASIGAVLHELIHAVGLFDASNRKMEASADALPAATNDLLQRRHARYLYQLASTDDSVYEQLREAAAVTDSTKPQSALSSANVSISANDRLSLNDADVQRINTLYNCLPSHLGVDGVARAIETGLSLNVAVPSIENGIAADDAYSHSSAHSSSSAMHNLRRSRPRTFYLFRNAADFRRRTGIDAPSWLRFAYNDEAPDYPRAIECTTNAESSCQDRSSECFELSLRGECERKPGVMLTRCRRSCCNCDNSKCFDSSDESKFRTLCLARFKNAHTNALMSACELELTRRNALAYCPQSCGVCFAKTTQ